MDFTPFRGAAAASTEQIKALLRNIFPQLPTDGWKRRSKKKQGKCEIRVFEHTDDGFTIEVFTEGGKFVDIKMPKKKGSIITNATPADIASLFAEHGFGNGIVIVDTYADSTTGKSMPKGDDPDYPIYQANQCLFAFGFDKVVIEVAAHWEAEHCLNDDIGGHSFPEGLLDSCGVYDVEDCEAIFTLLEDEKTVRAKMEAVGFTYSKELEEFLQ